MIQKILDNDKVLDKFPELAPLFKIEMPAGDCKPCVRGAYLRKVTAEYKRILRRSSIQESDLISYFTDSKRTILKGEVKEYGKAKITTKGIVNFTNSLLKRVVATANGEETLVTDKEYLDRIYQCRTCDKLENGCCSLCTCPIHEKCKVKTDSCPHPEGSRWKG